MPHVSGERDVGQFVRHIETTAGMAVFTKFFRILSNVSDQCLKRVAARINGPDQIREIADGLLGELPNPARG